MPKRLNSFDAGADANLVHENGVSALMYSAAANHVEVVKKVLIEKGKIDIDFSHTNGGTALLEAATGGAVEAMKLLIESGASMTLWMTTV
jgi:ankyrin repeat protein